MRRTLVIAASIALGLSAAAAPAWSAPCRDARGHFMKCPPRKPVIVRCRNAKGKFAKCGTPGARPF